MVISLIPADAIGQSKKDFYHKMDSLMNEMFEIQIRKDSLNSEILKRHQRIEEEQSKKIRHERRKNLILGIALIISIITISIIQ